MLDYEAEEALEKIANIINWDDTDLAGQLESIENILVSVGFEVKS